MTSCATEAGSFPAEPRFGFCPRTEPSSVRFRASGTDRGADAGQTSSDHGRLRRGHHVPGTGRGVEPARPAAACRGAAPRRPRGVHAGEPPVVPGDRLGGAAVGALLHRDQLTAAGRRARLHRRQLRRARLHLLDPARGGRGGGRRPDARRQAAADAGRHRRPASSPTRRASPRTRPRPSRTSARAWTCSTPRARPGGPRASNPRSPTRPWARRACSTSSFRSCSSRTRSRCTCRRRRCTTPRRCGTA